MWLEVFACAKSTHLRQTALSGFSLLPPLPSLHIRPHLLPICAHLAVLPKSFIKDLKSALEPDKAEARAWAQSTVPIQWAPTTPHHLLEDCSN